MTPKYLAFLFFKKDVLLANLDFMGNSNTIIIS